MIPNVHQEATSVSAKIGLPKTWFMTKCQEIEEVIINIIASMLNKMEYLVNIVVPCELRVY